MRNLNKFTQMKQKGDTLPKSPSTDK